MEHLEIRLSKEQLTALNLQTDMAKYLNSIFPPASSNYAQLAYELQREFKAGGSPEVTSIVFDRVKYDTEKSQGSLRIMLDINFTFGCEDMKTEKEDQTSEWTFRIDQANSWLHLFSSPFAESRSTADEF